MNKTNKLSNQAEDNQENIANNLNPKPIIQEEAESTLKITDTSERNWDTRFKKAENDLVNIGFTVDANVKIKKETLQHIAGFVEGEGSINIQIKTNKNLRFGIEIDPEFGLYQHNRSCVHLFTLCRYFKAGSVYIGKLKSGTTDQYEKASFRVMDKQSLVEKVVPFYEKYVIPFAGQYVTTRFEIWKKVLLLFKEGAHLKASRFYSELIPLAVGLRTITPRPDAKNDLTTVDKCQAFVKNIMIAKLNEKGKSCLNLTDLEICNLFDETFPSTKKKS